MRTALKIFKKLLIDGAIDDKKDSELFGEYFVPENHNDLNEIAEELDFDLVELPHNVYMVPRLSNPIIGFTIKELRADTSPEPSLTKAYLQCYIIMFILHLFYGGKNSDPKNTEFLQIKDIVSQLDERFGGIDADIEETKYGICFGAISELWSSKAVIDEGKHTTRVGFVLKACSFMENQKLFVLRDNKREVRTTERLDDLMINYYLGIDRVSEIREMFGEV